MRKLIAMVLALVMMLTLSVPVALAANDPVYSANSATVPTAANTTAQELATAQQNLIICIAVIVVIAAAVIVLIIVKRNNLKDVR